MVIVREAIWLPFIDLLICKVDVCAQFAPCRRDRIRCYRDRTRHPFTERSRFRADELEINPDIPYSGVNDDE